ncbi:hypothetical protein EHQ24_09590 [Leptospira noumeaensis]|uniref:Uncharacterized protein n=1 Tax=Leptospira noumeaensis TaxID=2484964 RepID=A0A4R9I655_9LEPT|nr:hypothetical protein [Leptospira noumeaensis]TGK81552.1 hypothetical protein EHQ24_09590 [Leptospira noumeaensis]
MKTKRYADFYEQNYNDSLLLLIRHIQQLSKEVPGLNFQAANFISTKQNIENEKQGFIETFVNLHNRFKPKESKWAKFIYYSFLIGFPLYLMQICSSYSFYHEKIFVKNPLKTYKSYEIDQRVDSLNLKSIDISNEPKLNWAVTVRKKSTGDKKQINIELPLYILRAQKITRENLDGELNIIGFKIAPMYQGEDFVNINDVITTESKEFKQILRQSADQHRVKFKSDFTNWEFDFSE